MTMWSLPARRAAGRRSAVDARLGRVSVQGDWRTATHRARDCPRSGPPSRGDRPGVREPHVRLARRVPDHTWLAAKPEGARATSAMRRSAGTAAMAARSSRMSDRRNPDAEWYGVAAQARCAILRGHDGGGDRQAAGRRLRAYPYAAEYRAWPGPNSDTFVATSGREIPEFRLTMPSTAIGKDSFPGPDRRLSPSHPAFSCPRWPRGRARRMGRGSRGEPARPRDRRRRSPSGAQAAGDRPRAGRRLTCSHAWLLADRDPGRPSRDRGDRGYALRR